MVDEFIGKYLSIARRAHAALLDKKLAPYNISHGQILLLVTLYKKEEGINQHRLCKIYNLDKAGVYRSIEKLKNNGFIIKKPDDRDKRKKSIHLTEKARNFKPVLTNILEEVEKQVRGDLNEEEIDDFIDIIREICGNLGVELEK